MKKLRATEGRPFIETITNYAWCFAGQGTSWLETLRAIGLTPALRSALTEVETRLNPIADVIDAVRPHGFTLKNGRVTLNLMAKKNGFTMRESLSRQSC